MQDVQRKLEEALEFSLYKELNDTTGEIEGLHPMVKTKMYTVAIEHNAAEEQWLWSDACCRNDYNSLHLESGNNRSSR